MLGKYISEHEIECKCGCGLKQLSPKTASMFDMLREAMGRSLVINSGCRCKEHNEKVGGKPDSAHIPDTSGTCHALDVSAISSEDKYNIVKILYMCGCKRIGFAKNFIHFDTRDTLPQRVMWPY